MELRQLTTFQMVARTLSFSQTAVSLNYAQSTVSAQIQTLESELGVTLFDRLGRKVVLTEAGRQLLDYADKMLALAGEAQTAVSNTDTPSGTLTISAPETLCTYRLPPLLQQYRTRYPDVQLIFQPKPSHDWERPLSDGSLDLMFVMDQPLKTAVLTIEALIVEPLLLLASPAHPLGQLDQVYYHDLLDRAFVLTEPSCGYRRLFERRLADVGIQPAQRMAFHSVEAIKQCVIAGLGATLLPEVAVQREVASGKLVVLPWEERPFEVVTQMIWHKKKWQSPALQAFLQMARECIGE
ncbi:MAG: LysR family transcriptional regulator [Chloroflexota bacterium]